MSPISIFLNSSNVFALTLSFLYIPEFLRAGLEYQKSQLPMAPNSHDPAGCFKPFSPLQLIKAFFYWQGILCDIEFLPIRLNSAFFQLFSFCNRTFIISFKSSSIFGIKQTSTLLFHYIKNFVPYNACRITYFQQ